MRYCGKFMIETPPQFETMAVVVLGSFNPAVFQPAWLSKNDLIRPEESDNANVALIGRGVCDFSTDWFSLYASDKRFAMETGDPAMLQPLRDLVAGIFRLLDQTPVELFGLNRARHFGIASGDDWRHFSSSFAPRQPWEGILSDPRLDSLSISGKRSAESPSIVTVQLGESIKLKHGVFIHVNEQFKITDESATSKQSQAMELVNQLHSHWDDFISYSSEISTYLFSNYKAATS